jgi:hypothetical protein
MRITDKLLLSLGLIFAVLGAAMGAAGDQAISAAIRGVG